MKIKKINMKSIDEIREKMIETVTSSKTDIFQIEEQSRQDYDSMRDELQAIKHMVEKLSGEGDSLEEQVRLEPMRRRLPDGLANLLLGLVVERDSRLFRRSIAVGLVGGGALLRASGEGGGAQGKADGRADQFTLHTGG